MDYKEMENNIIENIKEEIAILNFQKVEDFKSSQIAKEINFSINKIALFIFSVIIISSGCIFAMNIFKKTDNINKKYALGSIIRLDEEENYIGNVNMEYSYLDNIGIKVNNIILSDNDLDIILDFDFSKKTLNRNSVLVNYIIYDENNNVYSYADYNISDRAKNYKKFCRDMNINYQKENWRDNIYAKGQAQNNLLETNERLITQLAVKSDRKLPNSKKIYIRIFDIGYLDNAKFLSISNNNEWILEVNIPDEYHDRTNIELETISNTNYFVLNSAYITDTSMTLIAKLQGLEGSISNKVIVIDENGKEYKSKLIYRNGNLFTLAFDINKSIVTNKLYIKVLNNDKFEEIELVRK